MFTRIVVSCAYFRVTTIDLVLEFVLKGGNKLLRPVFSAFSWGNVAKISSNVKLDYKIKY